MRFSSGLCAAATWRSDCDRGRKRPSHQGDEKRATWRISFTAVVLIKDHRMRRHAAPRRTSFVFSLSYSARIRSMFFTFGRRSCAHGTEREARPPADWCARSFAHRERHPEISRLLSENGECPQQLPVLQEAHEHKNCRQHLRGWWRRHNWPRHGNPAGEVPCGHLTTLSTLCV